jgi:hypothetical protein
MPGPVHPVPFPRGVSGPSAGAGFFERLDGGLAALSLADGAARWSGGPAGRPLLASGERLIVAAPHGAAAIRFAVLGAGDGRLHAHRDLEIPPEAGDALAEDDLEMAAAMDGDRLRVEWSATLRGRGGAARAVGGPGRRVLGGVLHWDLATGAAAAELPADGGEAPARVPSWPYRRGDRWRDAGWRVGERTAWLELARDGEIEAVVLHLVGAGRERAVPLAVGRALEPTLTPDGTHLFLRRTAPPGATWTAFRVADGRRLAELPYTPHTRWPCLVGDRLFDLVVPEGREPPGPRLRAAAFPGGVVIWEHPLAPPVRRVPGPLPP